MLWCCLPSHQCMSKCVCSPDLWRGIWEIGNHLVVINTAFRMAINWLLQTIIQLIFCRTNITGQLLNVFVYSMINFLFSPTMLASTLSLHHKQICAAYKIQISHTWLHDTKCCSKSHTSSWETRLNHQSLIHLDSNINSELNYGRLLTKSQKSKIFESMVCSCRVQHEVVHHPK